MPQVSINFNRMTKDGLKTVINKFEKKGMQISDVEATNVAKRESGFLVKNAIFVFESGQKLLIRAKADGAIFQVRLNNKVLPIKNVDSLSRGIDEIIEHVKSNEARYIKAKEKRLAKVKLNIDKQPKATTTRRQKLEQAESAVNELTSEQDNLRKSIESIRSGVDSKKAQLSELNDKLKTLQDRGKALENELTGLKAEVAEA